MHEVGKSLGGYMFKHQVDFKNGHFAKLKKVLHLECKSHQTRLCVALKYSEIHLKIGEKDKLYYKCHLFTRATYSKVVHDPKNFRKNASRSAVSTAVPVVWIIV